MPRRINARRSGPDGAELHRDPAPRAPEGDRNPESKLRLSRSRPRVRLIDVASPCRGIGAKQLSRRRCPRRGSLASRKKRGKRLDIAEAEIEPLRADRGRAWAASPASATRAPPYSRTSTEDSGKPPLGWDRKRGPRRSGRLSQPPPRTPRCRGRANAPHRPSFAPDETAAISGQRYQRERSRMAVKLDADTVVRALVGK